MLHDVRLCIEVAGLGAGLEVRDIFFLGALFNVAHAV